MKADIRSRLPASLAALACGVGLSALGIVTAQADADATAAPSVNASATGQQLRHAGQHQGNWLTYGKDYAGHRFSSLDQINPDTVKNLHVAWTMQLGGTEGGGMWPNAGLEGTPLADNGFLYVTNGWGTVYKIDARDGHGTLVWKMNPKTDRNWAGNVTCCGVDNRGAALWHNLVISATLDGRLIATNKETGKIVWQKRVASPDKGYTITGAPLVVKDMAITGVAGAEMGIRGFIEAVDIKTGKKLWRTYTIPEGNEAGANTWPSTKDANHGGGSTWVTGTYAPKTNTLFWGVGNPGPDWDSAYRPGNNLYTDSTLALDPDTGKIKWHFQQTPNDGYDYDAVGENVLVNLPDGKRLDLEASRNGFAYALNRENGKFLWATQFVSKLNWTKGINPKTGKPVEYKPGAGVQHYAVTPTPSHPVVTICPGNMGGKNWPPTAYNPHLKLWYIPVIESCNVITLQKPKPGPIPEGKFFTGGGPSEHQRITGSVTAINVETGKEVGKLKTKYPMLGGILATPRLIFFGTPNGKFVAADAKTLKPLWTFDTGSGINAPPITFAVNGKQYIALEVGNGGAWGHWFIDATPGLKKIEPSSTLYVFGLSTQVASLDK